MSGKQLLHYCKLDLNTKLAPYIKYAWVMKAFEPKSRYDLLIPDGYPEIIFVKEGAYEKAFLTPDQPSIIINRSCVIGIQTRTILARRLDH
ncbi:MAG: hypothetical protein MRY78_13635 [Saprospiraceae bacterium]|nr:hypothetical protein [Saprospiraceae bacterium]